jgi:aldose 1-epimerase
MEAHDQRLTIVEVGGGIRTYDRAGIEVIDGYAEDEMCPGGRGQILAPWPNRLGDGRYEWRGRTLQTAITEVATSTAIHGLVRWMAWDVEATGSDSAESRLRMHPQPGWVWTLDLAAAYRLSPDGLEVTLTATNSSPAEAGACPFGAGWHPYLAARGVVDDAWLTVPARVGYRTDERGLPVGRFDVQGSDRDLRTGRLIGAAQLDWCYTDLVRRDDGRAVVHFDPLDGPALDLWVDRNWTHLMVFTGDTLADEGRRRRGLAVEPMTGPPDLLRSGDGRRVLEPGESFSASWGIEFSAAGQ